MNELELSKQYIYHWFNGQLSPDSKDESDAFYGWYLQGKPRRELKFAPAAAYEAAQVYFAHRLPTWKTSNPEYADLTIHELWEKLNNHYYNFLRDYRKEPARERQAVVCSAHEAPDYHDADDDDEPQSQEERDVKCGDLHGRLSAREQFLNLYCLPSTAWLAEEGGLGGALIIRLLMRRLPVDRTADLLLRILMAHPLLVPKDSRKFHRPLVAHVARNYWHEGREELLDQKAVAAVLGVSEFEISTAKSSPAPSPLSAEEIDHELNALEAALLLERALVQERLEAALKDIEETG